ncbi:hypothetical protein [Helicobacter cetorum]|uniref:hypothetical protein n=1 Tax=Helicobacter cetorum TaxID=138563 RepID=UPI0013152F21|nr:hypothetical protein [Helicobacter cetorum]
MNAEKKVIDNFIDYCKSKHKRVDVHPTSDDQPKRPIVEPIESPTDPKPNNNEVNQ